MSKYLHDWAESGEAGMLSDFGIDKKEIDGATILVASYTYEDYSGSAFVLFERDGKLFEVNGSHCSCFGLEGQWDPEETSVEALRHRITEGTFGEEDKIKDEVLAVLDAMERPVAANDNHRTLRSANHARQKEWDAGNQLTLAYRGNELGGEAGEAQNVIKKLERERLGIAGSRDTIEHLAEELADVVICCDLIALQVGIDLDAAVVAKFNATSEKVGLRARLVAA